MSIQTRATASALVSLAALSGADPQQGVTEVLPGDPFERLSEPLRKSLAALDPLQEGWLTEARSNAALEQLRRIVRCLETPGADAGQMLADLCGESFAWKAPREIEPVFADGAFRVRRSRGHEALAGDDLDSMLARLRDALGGRADIHVKLKMVQVEEESGGFVTHALLLLSGHGADGALQINTLWRCHWLEREDGPPALSALEVLEYEEVQGAPGPGQLFADCTESLLGGNAAWTQQLLPGLSYWRARLDTRLGVPLLGHAAGIAVGDVDGDGLEDVYLCQPGGLPNKLFLHRPDGTALDRSTEGGVDFLDFSRSALLLDFDNDGDRDLAVTVVDQLLLLSNDGQAHFWLESALPAPDATSLAAADFDLDGDLDLFACAYASPYDHSALPVPYHDANNGRPNTLWENGGEWIFVDATQSRGLDHNNRRFSFAASWEDYDQDGDPDLYVANDFGRKNLYRNDRGQFVDVASQAGVEDISAGMGVSWGDYDGDGWMDLYASNMYSAAGNRIAFQPRFQAAAGEPVRALYQRHARGNSLFRNARDGTFVDVTEQADVAMGRWAWGALFADLNNDGWQDLLSPNGFITEELSDDL